MRKEIARIMNSLSTDGKSVTGLTRLFKDARTKQRPKNTAIVSSKELVCNLNSFCKGQPNKYQTIRKKPKKTTIVLVRGGIIIWNFENMAGACRRILISISRIPIQMANNKAVDRTGL